LRLVDHNFSMQDVIGSRNAYVGFTSASSQSSTMDVSISNVIMKTVKVATRFTESKETLSAFPKQFVANGRDTVSFTMQVKDACQNELNFGGLSTSVSGRLVSTSISSAPPSSGRLLVEDNNLTILADVIDHSNGEYSVQFTTDVLANFSVFMAFGTNCTWNGTGFSENANLDCWTISYQNAAESIPFSTNAPTSVVEPDALPTSTLVGVGVAAGVIAVCGSVLLFAGIRMRNQWRRDKRFVDEGKKIVAEKGVSYMGDNELDVLQNQLQATMHSIQAERAKRLKNVDKQDVIDELLRQKGELQEMVRRLKIQKEGGDPNLPEDRMTVGSRVRKSFAAARTSRGASMNPSRTSRGISLFNTQAGEASAGNPLFNAIRSSIRNPMRKPDSNSAVVVAELDRVQDA